MTANPDILLLVGMPLNVNMPHDLFKHKFLLTNLILISKDRKCGSLVWPPYIKPRIFRMKTHSLVENDWRPCPVNITDFSYTNKSIFTARISIASSFWLSLHPSIHAYLCIWCMLLFISQSTLSPCGVTGTANIIHHSKLYLWKKGKILNFSKFNSSKP